ncbi:MAG: histidine triad nucleotide-binding protein [Alphaproteobacteria bacterium]
MAYDDDNIFARILRGEIPNKTVYEDAHVLAFHDIRPQAPVHVLVLPKGKYVSADDFGANAPAEQVVAFWRAVSRVARDLGLDGSGYRVIANHGADSHQEVAHFHVHILGGRKLGPMLTPRA